jgi:hypothetical protein
VELAAGLLKESLEAVEAFLVLESLQAIRESTMMLTTKKLFMFVNLIVHKRYNFPGSERPAILFEKCRHSLHHLFICSAEMLEEYYGQSLNNLMQLL